MRQTVTGISHKASIWLADDGPSSKAFQGIPSRYNHQGAQAILNSICRDARKIFRHSPGQVWSLIRQFRLHEAKRSKRKLVAKGRNPQRWWCGFGGKQAQLGPAARVPEPLLLRHWINPLRGAVFRNWQFGADKAVYDPGSRMKENLPNWTCDFPGYKESGLISSHQATAP